MRNKIKSAHNPKVQHKLLEISKKIPQLFAGLIFISAILVLVGWWMDISFLKSISVNWVSMKVNTALGFVLVSISLFMYEMETLSKLKTISWQITALLVTLLGALTLYEYLFDASLGLDQLIFPEPPGTVGTSNPGRMAPSTSLSFILLGLSVFSMKIDSKKGHPIGHYLVTLVGMNSIAVILAYIYQAETIYGIAQYTHMAIHTAALFGIASLGVFCINLNHSFFSILISKGAGGIVARKISFAGIIVPIILGLLYVVGREAGLYPMEVGMAIYSSSIIFFIISMAWWTAVLADKEEDKRILLSREQEKLRTESIIRDRFVSMLVHDLRTPLTSAKINAQLIMRQENNTTKGREQARKITVNIDRTDQMLKDLLDLKLITEGHSLHIKISECQLLDICQGTISDLSEVYGPRFFLKGEQISGHWSSHGLRRMIENLLVNAVKYGSKDSPITITIKRAGDEVIIEIHNKGSIISKEDRARLFMPFQRAASAQISDSPGWGIGLTIVRATALAHGGTVDVESTPEAGTTFLISLPIDSRLYVDKNKIISPREGQDLNLQ